MGSHICTSSSILEQVAQLDRPLLKGCQFLGFKSIQVFVMKYSKITDEKEISSNIAGPIELSLIF